MAVAIDRASRMAKMSCALCGSAHTWSFTLDPFQQHAFATGSNHDIFVNQNASCLIMTTEILRSMLYGGSDILRELEWVIFDEVAFTATVPNTEQFANCGSAPSSARQHLRDLATSKAGRFLLEHYLYTGNSSATSKELFLFIDSRSKFQRTGGYEAAVLAKKQRESSGGAGGGWRQMGRPGLAVIWIRKQSELATQRIDTMVQSLTALQKLDLNTARMLAKGLGVHHGGVLPFSRRLWKLLFQKGLVKLLFATETFAMGVNMPAKTVLFDTVLHSDGRPGGPQEAWDAHWHSYCGVQIRVVDAGTPWQPHGTGQWHLSSSLERISRHTTAMILNPAATVGRLRVLKKVLRPQLLRGQQPGHGRGQAGASLSSLRLRTSLRPARPAVLPSLRRSGYGCLSGRLAGEHSGCANRATKEILTCFRTFIITTSCLTPPRPAHCHAGPGQAEPRHSPSWRAALQLDGNRHAPAADARPAAVIPARQLRNPANGDVILRLWPPSARLNSPSRRRSLSRCCWTCRQPTGFERCRANRRPTRFARRGQPSERCWTILNGENCPDLPTRRAARPSARWRQELADLLRSRYAAAAPSRCSIRLTGWDLKKIDQTQLFARLAECDGSPPSPTSASLSGFSAPTSARLCGVNC
uniref:Helicase C-terminal domain-containing protein n=1 Tax=Macrostomum lignano TaxID=282301 RepID=A0A1I8JPA7_9PLAT